ncbi:hypothetical protein BKA57DRAFT_441239 [Linnemannia elongata]|uniref:YncI copper-binding domain-containing protein n=1 Tax=Linnemannia elongata AG-77 TaxID=1314771 RepID=A0A197JWR8_9FUNG|nr:hypothetical protein BKA57DRAFT_441239 [Linnemannia elongata]OAQ29665.1 hypothetical protein K457DRAFT_137544 [Linnemannia elongata AG-77]
MKFLAVATAVVSTLLLATSNVEAHVTANPSVGVSGAYFQTNFRVPHGCEGNATDLVIVEIPKNVTSVKPRATYPWNTTINMIPLAVPIVTPTGTVNMTVGSVTWSNGNLADNMYEDFGLQFKLPQIIGPLYWSVYQHCVNGGWQNWTNIPDAKGATAGFPAAVITISNTTTTAPGASPSTGGDNKSAAVASQIFGLGQVALVGAGALMLAML